MNTPYHAFYIAAHPDDIELFMSKNAWEDVSDRAITTTFIVLSAGDAGKTAAEGVDAYYLARELAHERTVRFWAGIAHHSTATDESQLTLAGKNVVKKAVGERVSIYNLRLPDGAPSGNGYEATGHQSLTRLRSGAIASITAIDQRFTLSYAELIDLLAAIMLNESHPHHHLWLNLQDDDRLTNPFDHSEHTATAETAIAAASRLAARSVGFVKYTTYVNAIRDINLHGDDYMKHAGTWGALNSGLADSVEPTEWRFDHNFWIGKMYFRTEPDASPYSRHHS